MMDITILQDVLDRATVDDVIDHPEPDVRSARRMIGAGS